VATAASTALPPRWRIRAPTRAPSECSAATMPCGAGAVRFVTARRDSIMGSIVEGRAASGPKRVLRDVDDHLVLHEDAPARRVRPRLVRLALPDRRPELARELLHLGRLGDPAERRPEQDHDLLRRLSDRDLADELEGRDVHRVGRLGILAKILADPRFHHVVPAAPLVEVRLAAVRDEDLHGPDIFGHRPLGGPLLLGAPGAAGQDHDQDCDRDALHASNHIRADSKTMPRSITREAWASTRPVSAGTSGLSASWRSRSMRRRIARIRSPSWPPKASSTIPLQSSSPDAQRKTAGMKPECTAIGIRRWRARCASCTVSATRMSWSSLRLSLGRFFKNVRASAGSPERASSINAEQTGAASGPETSSNTPCATPSATRSSLSWRRPAMSRPLSSSRRSRTAPNCSRVSTTRRNSCQ